MMLRTGLVLACIVLLFSQTVRADVVVMDQIGTNGAFLSEGNANVSQFFEPANAAFTSATVDDFSLSSPTTLTSVQAAMLAFNSGTFASFAGVTSWEVAIYSSKSAAATTIIGDIADVSIAPSSVTITAGIVTLDPSSALVTIPVSIALKAGTYEIAVIPHLDSSQFGELGVYQSSGGNPGGANAATANPGGGFAFPGNLQSTGEDAGYRITAASVPEPSSVLMVSIGLGLGLIGLRRSQVKAATT